MWNEAMPDDRAVIQQVLAGETEAFRVLVERYQGPLFGLLGSLLPAAEREDIAQDTFLTAFDRLAQYDAERGRVAACALAALLGLAWMGQVMGMLVP